MTTSYKLAKRHVLIGMCFISVFVCYIDRVNISVAAIKMAEEFGWSATQKGAVLSSFFIGYLISQIPSGMIANRFGGKALLGFALMWWSLFTILTPMAATVSMSVFIAARIAMGAGEAATFPAIYNLYSVWLPVGERSRAITFMLAGIPLGTVFALATTGPLIEAFGWQSVFYVFGAAGVVFAIVWLAVVHAAPARHPRISAEERALIGTGGSGQVVEIAQTPVSALLRKPAVWALVINHFCSNWSLYVLLSWLPSYFRDVIGLSISQAGLFSAGPWLSMFIGSNLSGVIADRMIQRGVSITATRKIMQCIGLLGSATFLLVAIQAPSQTAAVVTLCAALGLLGFTWAGYAPNHLDIAPRHAGFLIGFTNTFGTIPGIVGVYVTGWLIDTTGSYASAFILSASISGFGALVWLLFATGRRIAD